MAKAVLLSAAFLLAQLHGLSWSYDRNAAVSYADRYYFSPNSRFVEYSGATGSDCSNFISQALIAGNMRFDPLITGGLVDDKGAMIRARELADELQIHHGGSPVVDYAIVNSGTATDLPVSLPLGDPMFLMRLLGGDLTSQVNYWLEGASHAMIIVDHNPLAFDAHSDSYFHKPFVNVSLDMGSWFRWVPLPTAPIIKYLRLYETQGGHETTIVEYAYDDDYDPGIQDGEYYAHTYNGLHPTRLDVDANEGIAISGALKLQIIFDSIMEQQLFAVSFGNNVPLFNQVSFETLGWSQTHQANDTWEGQATNSVGISSPVSPPFQNPLRSVMT